MEIHRTLGDKVRLYRRREGGAWHCSTYLKGKEWRQSTKEKSLARAKDIAEDWYLELCAKDRFGELGPARPSPRPRRNSKRNTRPSPVGHRSPKWVQGHKDRIRLHLLPLFRQKIVSEITSGVVQEYRVHRMTEPKTSTPAPKDNEDDGAAQAKPWKPPARNTIHNEIVTLSMVLKTAQRHGWLEYVPDLSDPYRRQSKVEHRPWFTPNEYKQLYEATRRNAAAPEETSGSSGTPSSCTTSCCSWPTRAAPGRSEAAGIPRRRDRRRRIFRRPHPGDRSPRQARRRLLQEHAGSGAPVRAAARSRAADSRALGS